MFSRSPGERALGWEGRRGAGWDGCSPVSGTRESSLCFWHPHKPASGRLRRLSSLSSTVVDILHSGLKGKDSVCLTQRFPSLVAWLCCFGLWWHKPGWSRSDSPQSVQEAKEGWAGAVLQYQCFQRRFFRSSSTFPHVLEHIYSCVFLSVCHLCVCLSVCLCIEIKGQTLVLFLDYFLLVSLRQGLSVVCNLPSNLGWLARKSLGYTCLDFFHQTPVIVYNRKHQTELSP